MVRFGLLSWVGKVGMAGVYRRTLVHIALKWRGQDSLDQCSMVYFLRVAGSSADPWATPARGGAAPTKAPRAGDDHQDRHSTSAHPGERSPGQAGQESP